MRLPSVLLVAAMTILVITDHATAADPAAPLVEQYLHAGDYAGGEKALAAHLQKQPDDAQARFGLGVLRTVRAVERLGQSLHRYGLRSDRGRQLRIPILRLPVPLNAEPQPFTYADARRIVQEFLGDLTQAEAALAEIQDDAVKLPLRMGLVRLDLVGDGKAGQHLSTVIAQHLLGLEQPGPAADWPVTFDRGDVDWLRGYCHLLMGIAEFTLAHDGQELFNGTAHLFFAKPVTPHPFLLEPDAGSPVVFDGVNLLDVIAMIHLVRLPVQEPQRMQASLAHFQKTLALSRQSWKHILAERDNDREWLPNPKQTGVLGIAVRQEMVDSWLAMVAESEAVLDGKRLIPFWRNDAKKGVNLRRVFTEPRTFDLVLWVQGTAATPYLENGELTRPEVWNRLQEVFGGNFFGFAAWFN